MKQNSMNERPINVIAFIKGQHEEIKALFAQVLEAQDAKREGLFTQLKTLLTVHEAAEEKIVHSEAKKVIAGGAAEVAAREKEEAAAKDALTALSKLDAASPEFEMKLRSSGRYSRSNRCSSAH
jgi:hemerythrin superfamily protein